MIYVRRGRKIISISDSKTSSETYKSINEAKRKSRLLQLSEDGALGRGSVVAE